MSNIATIEAGYFDSISYESWKLNWSFAEYKRRYVSGLDTTMEGHPELEDDCWNWRRQLDCSRLYEGEVLLCCPEDVKCERDHAAHLLCERCSFPLCRRCLLTSRKQDPSDVGIPEALTNDNFWGYVTDK